jgi:sulfonate transport system ATP-binding protein
MSLRNPASGLQLREVLKRFGTIEVLRDMELEIGAGEFVAVVGRSGSGKSTLLRLLAGLDQPTAGTVLIDGRPLEGLNETARLMFQEARLLPWLRVGANVRLGLPRQRWSSAERLLHQVGLADRAADWPAVLSGGQRQRVALARALASEPHLLLLDEPLGSLDALTRIEMQLLVEQLWLERGFTAVLITHDVEEAVMLADRVLLLENGRFSQDLTVSLPRPRDRCSPGITSLVRSMLDRLLLQNRDDPSIPTL